MAHHIGGNELKSLQLCSVCNYKDHVWMHIQVCLYSCIWAEDFMPSCLCGYACLCVFVLRVSGKETPAHWKASDMLSWVKFKLHCQQHVNSMEKDEMEISAMCRVNMGAGWWLSVIGPMFGLMVHPYTQQYWRPHCPFLCQTWDICCLQS